MSGYGVFGYRFAVGEVRYVGDIGPSVQDYSGTTSVSWNYDKAS